MREIALYIVLWKHAKIQDQILIRSEGVIMKAVVCEAGTNLEKDEEEDHSCMVEANIPVGGYNACQNYRPPSNNDYILAKSGTQLARLGALVATVLICLVEKAKNDELEEKVYVDIF